MRAFVHNIAPGRQGVQAANQSDEITDEQFALLEARVERLAEQVKAMPAEADRLVREALAGHIEMFKRDNPVNGVRPVHNAREFDGYSLNAVIDDVTGGN